MSGAHRVFALSCHASYRCRHAGACCTAGWPIPVESDRLARLRAAIAARALQPPRAIDDARLFEALPGAPTGTPAVLGVVDRACVFFDAERGRTCAVQRALGHDALPLACRQFPRVVVRDPRGVSVTLSHYCPTAASLLSAPGPPSIVTDAAAFPPDAEYSGLDATTSLPPALTPHVLMDWPSWWEIEHLAVDLIAVEAGSPERALARLGVLVEHARAWRPGGGAPLVTAVRTAGEHARATTPVGWAPSGAWLAERCQIALGAVPPELLSAAPAVSPSGASDISATVLTHFLSAHAFANWTAHLGRGLRSWQRSLEVAFALVRSGRSVRDADLILRHLADPHAFAAACSLAEDRILPSPWRTGVRV